MAGKPTIIEVARAAGVSKSTVSRVLLGGAQVKQATKTRVLETIDTLGYERNELARSLRTDRTRMIMLALPDITNPFWAEIARGLQDTVEAAGYSVVIANTDWDAQREQRFLSTARRNRFDAIIINPVAVTARSLLDSAVPTVILGLLHEFSNIDTVGSDSYQGTQHALDYLYTLGHRRIACIRGMHQHGRGHDRYRAYTDFLHQHALPVDPALVVEVPFDLVGGQRAAQILLTAETRPTAIFAANDILAIGAMQTAISLGIRVPDDLSVIGMDDVYAAAIASPALTTMAKAKYEIGVWAGRLMFDRLHTNEPIAPRQHAIPCTLVVRESTARRP